MSNDRPVMSGENKRQQYQAAKEPLAGKVGAVEGESGGNTQRQGNEHGSESYNETIEH
jgi:hypothetical protein